MRSNPHNGPAHGCGFKLREKPRESTRAIDFKRSWALGASPSTVGLHRGRAAAIQRLFWKGLTPRSLTKKTERGGVRGVYREIETPEGKGC
jgi:hypothetical protein